MYRIGIAAQNVLCLILLPLDPAWLARPRDDYDVMLHGSFKGQSWREANANMEKDREERREKRVREYGKDNEKS